MWDALASLIASLVATAIQRARKVRVTVHLGYLQGNVACYFVNVTNLSPSRDVEITRVWFATTPKLEVLNLERLLLKRLRPDESWETWVPVDQVPQFDRPYAGTRARVQLSSGKAVRSINRRDVPPFGIVPGGGK